MGEAVGLDTLEPGSALPFSDEKIATAEQTLQQIIKLFEATVEKSASQTRRVSESEFTARMRKMCGKMESLSIGRKNKAADKTSLLRKTKWALIGRQEFVDLVQSISSIVNELVAAFPAPEVLNKQAALREADAAEMTKLDSGVVELLKDALGEQDKQLRAALEKAAASSDVYNNTTHFTGSGNQGWQQGVNHGTQTVHFGK